MIPVLHVPAFADNYIWLIRAGDLVAVVDPGDAQPVLAMLERERLRPAAILCTHHHADHVGGVQTLAHRYGVPVYGPARERIPGITCHLDEGDVVDLPALGLQFDVLAVPGHTLGHIALFSSAGDDPLLFCGDTMFSAGCGKLFEGSPEQMYNSLSRLSALPQDTRVFCGHEYTAANLRFARTVEPDNPHVHAHIERVGEWRAQDRPSLPSTIETERRINPFLRVVEPSVRRAAQTHAGHPLAADVEVFATLRRWKDGFRG